MVLFLIVFTLPQRTDVNFKCAPLALLHVGAQLPVETQGVWTCSVVVIVCGSYHHSNHISVSQCLIICKDQTLGNIT